MLKVTLSERMIKMAHDNFERCTRAYEDKEAASDEKTLGCHHKPKLSYQWMFEAGEFDELGDEFPAEVEFQDKVWKAKHLQCNGFGLFDLTYECDDAEMYLSGIEGETKRGRQIIFEGVKRGMGYGVDTLRRAELTQESTGEGVEWWINYGEADLSPEHLEAIVVEGTLYCLANVKVIELPAIKTQAVKFMPRRSMTMTYLAVKDHNGPCAEDILSVRDIRHGFPLDVYSEWQGPLICRELFEDDDCNDCKEKEKDDEHAHNLN